MLVASSYHSMHVTLSLFYNPDHIASRALHLRVKDKCPYRAEEDVFHYVCFCLKLTHSYNYRQLNLLLYAVIRMLQDFESPYVSLEAGNKETPHRITFRRK